MRMDEVHKHVGSLDLDSNVKAVSQPTLNTEHSINESYFSTPAKTETSMIIDSSGKKKKNPDVF